MKLSVVVPIYNVERYLKKCIDSLINQKELPYEIILVDDGSTDSSGAICEQYAENVEYIYVYHKENQGLGLTRNFGIEQVKGDFVIFVDSDDYLDEDYFLTMNKLFEKEHFDTCKTCFRRVNDLGEKSFENKVLSDEIYVGEDVLKCLFPRLIGSAPDAKDAVPMSSCCTIYSMEIIKKYNIRFVSEREWISEDILFNLEYYARAQKILLSSYVGYNYRINNNSLTTKYLEDRFEKSIRMYKREKELLLNIDLFESCEYRLARQFFIYTRMSIRQLKGHKNNKKWKCNEIKKICDSDFLRSIISAYPVNKLGFKQKVFIYLIKYRCVNSLYWVFCK